MALVKRSRTLRPSSRATGSPYKVNTIGTSVNDILQLTIFHEAQQSSVLCMFEFRGRDISGKRSIHFAAQESGGSWKLTFSGANPTSVTI